MDNSKKPASNIDHQTVDSFADEWSRYDQANLDQEELNEMFAKYFRIFPWHRIHENAVGFDMGCGTGRWAKLVAGRVGHLALIDVSPITLDVARKNLAETRNVDFLLGSTEELPLKKESQDFGYSLGVLHHIPDTQAALAACVTLLKPDAPFLLYLYYRFDNRPPWYAALWKCSEMLRSGISKLPAALKYIVTDVLALTVYWPMARLAAIASRTGIDTNNFPLTEYRNRSIYTMRTDCRDRFGTPLEQRFTRQEIFEMMTGAGLNEIEFSETQPYWCAVGIKCSDSSAI